MKKELSKKEKIKNSLVTGIIITAVVSFIFGLPEDIGEPISLGAFVLKTIVVFVVSMAGAWSYYGMKKRSEMTEKERKKEEAKDTKILLYGVLAIVLFVIIAFVFMYLYGAL